MTASESSCEALAKQEAANALEAAVDGIHWYWTSGSEAPPHIGDSEKQMIREHIQRAIDAAEREQAAEFRTNCMGCGVWHARDAAEKQLTQANAIIEKIAKTADGVTMLPEMEVYQWETRDAGETWFIVAHKVRSLSGPAVFPFPGWFDRRCYSTRAVAEAAKEGQCNAR